MYILSLPLVRVDNAAVSILLHITSKLQTFQEHGLVMKETGRHKHHSYG
jgi:hypothetical protein